MDKKQISIAVISVVAVALAVTAATAGAWAIHTPLYTIRMEQASNKMNFLPTERNAFTYATEKGYTLNYNLSGGYCGGIVPLASDGDPGCDDTTSPQCLPDPESLIGTCEGWTCGNTCWYTCRYVNTCANTCPDTCPYSCGVPTCGNTCGNTCPETECDPECQPPP